MNQVAENAFCCEICMLEFQCKNELISHVGDNHEVIGPVCVKSEPVEPCDFENKTKNTCDTLIEETKKNYLSLNTLISQLKSSGRYSYGLVGGCLSGWVK